MIGMLEIGLIILVGGAIFFFGKDKMLEWAQGAGEAQVAFKEAAKGKTKKTKKIKRVKQSV